MIGRQRELIQAASRLLADPKPMKVEIAKKLVDMALRIRPLRRDGIAHPDAPSPGEEVALLGTAQQMLTRRTSAKKLPREGEYPSSSGTVRASQLMEVKNLLP